MVFAVRGSAGDHSLAKVFNRKKEGNLIIEVVVQRAVVDDGGCECGCTNKNRLHWAAIKCSLHPLGADVPRTGFVHAPTRSPKGSNVLGRDPPRDNGLGRSGRD